MTYIAGSGCIRKVKKAKKIGKVKKKKHSHRMKPIEWAAKEADGRMPPIQFHLGSIEFYWH